MRLPSHPDFHLTYCTNIHPADGWDGVLSSLRRYAPALRRRFAPTSPFGVGLRLSARDAAGLLTGTNLSEFRTLLDDEGLYVADDQRLSVRAVPRDAGEGQRLRARLARSRAGVLHARPDSHPAGARARGRRRRRVDRTAFLQAVDGRGRERRLGDDRRATSCASPRGSRGSTRTRARSSISTSSRSPTARWRTPPRPSSSSSAACCREARRMLARALQRLRIGGARASCSSTSASVSTAATSRSSSRTPPRRWNGSADAGIKIGRVQLSSALDVAVPADKDAAAAVMERLRPFADTTYLHQVVERRDGELRHYLDLPDVLERVNADPEAADLADSFPRAAVHRRVRRAGIDAALRRRRPAPRARDAGDHAPRDRNVYVGRAAGRTSSSICSSRSPANTSGCCETCRFCRRKPWGNGALPVDGVATPAILAPNSQCKRPSFSMSSA